jgi:hypothetical protein
MTAMGFTQRVQLALIILLLTAIIAIGQPWSFELYKLAIVVIVITGLTQVAVGNIPSNASRLRFAKLLFVFAAIIAAIFALSIWLAPILVGLGR